MKQRILAGVIIIGAAGVWVTSGRSSKGSGSSSLSSVQRSSPVGLGIVKEDLNKVSNAKIPFEEKQGLAKKTPQAATGVAAMAIPVPHAEELKDYAHLKRKVFLTEEEKALRKSYLESTEMLQSLGNYLRTPSAETPESETARNAATDLLLEAALTQKSAVAEAALQAVIVSNAVEESSVEPAQRQKLAETKAEILYQWSAMDPTKAPLMQTWLPGPVSQRIWQNVLQAQRQNVAESAALPRK